MAMFICEECSRSYVRQSQLIIHMRQHTGERPFSCQCGKSYTRKDHLRRHQQSCLNKQTSSPLNEELIEASPQRRLYPCPQCGAGPFRQKKMVWAHVAMVHRERKHVCDQCSKAFPTKSKLARHSTKHHGFTCPYCSVDMNEASPITFNNFVGLRRHIASVHPKPVLNCTVCGKRFDRPSRLQEHEQTHTPGGPELRRQFVCPLCPPVPPSVSNRSIPSPGIAPLDVSSGTANAQVIAFTAKRNLHAHMRLVHTDLVFPCTWSGCPVLLSTKQKLSQHLKRHEANRPVAQSSRSRRRNPQGQQLTPVKQKTRQRVSKLADEEDETASQSSIVALLLDSGDELTAQ